MNRGLNFFSKVNEGNVQRPNQIIGVQWFFLFLFLSNKDNAMAMHGMQQSSLSLIHIALECYLNKYIQSARQRNCVRRKKKNVQLSEFTKMV